MRRTCLRCDWEGEASTTTCPRCGARSLYDVGAQRSTSPAPEPQRPPGRSEGPQRSPPTAPIEDAVDEVPDRGNERIRRRRSTGAVATVVAILLGAMLWWAVANDAAPTVAAPSASELSPIPSPYVPIPSPAPELPPFRGRVHKASPEVSTAPGRHRIRVEGIPLSVDIPAEGWRRAGSLYLSKGEDRARSAEAMLYWTVIDRGRFARPCGQWWGAPDGSALDFARSALGSHGVETMVPAQQEQVAGVDGGFAAFRVRRNQACQPGYFYRWLPPRSGTSWSGIEVGDTVRIWVVDLGTDRVFIEADTHASASPELTTELGQIVASIRLELIG